MTQKNINRMQTNVKNAYSYKTSFSASKTRKAKSLQKIVIAVNSCLFNLTILKLKKEIRN